MNVPSNPRSIILHQPATLLAIALLLAAAPLLRAQTTTSAPLPSQLTTATTAFLANAGIDNTDSTEAYNAFYHDLSTWNHFQLKPTPAMSEVTFELKVDGMITNVSSGSSIGVTYLLLTIRDTRTHALLWTLSENVRPAARQKTLIVNIDAAAAKLLTDLKAISTPATTAPTQ